MGVIFIAPPAAGKGTISKFLESHYGYKHLSTGDLLRNISKQNTMLGKNIANLLENGEFIPDEVIFTLIKKELDELKGKPFILDGVPRNQKQAEYLDNMLQENNVDNYVVIHIDVDKETLKKRATGRRICSNCSTSYNIYFDGFKPKEADICDICGNKLAKRKDDAEEIFQIRFKTYLEATKPLLDYYQKKHLLYKVDASKNQEEILDCVERILKGEKND